MILPLIIGTVVASAVADRARGSVTWPIPESIRQRMLNTTWREGCPVALDDLAILDIPHWNNDMQYTTGSLVIHHNISEEVLDIFEELFHLPYPIALMRPMFMFGGNDTLGMMSNNTSGFNCRPKTGSTDEFSLHSYGCAIDVNTFTNPYQCGSFITPPGSEEYVNRSIIVPGTITPDGPIRNAFLRRGWNWGGEWITRQDFQHFQKDRFCDMILLP